MSLSKTFCPAPFIQLQISHGNKFGPCPYTASCWSKTNSDIKDKWQSPELDKLRKNLLNNNKDEICKRCWNEEDANKKSLRLRLLQFKHAGNLHAKVFKKFIEEKKYVDYPKILTLIPGNECNLSCPSCSPKFSSKWNSLLNQNDYNGFQKKVDNWNLTDEQYQEIVNNSEKLQKIELFGGEPFLNKKNRVNLVEKLIKKGTSKNITLYFNTNGTIYDDDFIQKIAKNFKFVEIRLSVDGTKNHFEYLRYGAKFSQVTKNAEKFSKLANSNLECICTVSVFNVFYLHLYDDFFMKKNWPVYYNIANTPKYLEIYNIPEPVKNNLKFDEKFNDVKNYMTNRKCDNNEWQKFIKYTQILEKNRGLSFKNTFSEFYDLVKNYGFDVHKD